ncbi:MAG: hypothetical protein SGILL_009128 [Bacillariaceae sp.]
MHLCPNDKKIYNITSCPRRTGQQKGVHELKIARQVINEFSDSLLSEYLQLNGTFIQQILETTTTTGSRGGGVTFLNDLLTTNICSMQFRFGDYWFRGGDSPKTLKDKRLCKEFDKGNNYTIDQQEKCFMQQAEVLLTEACPDPLVPVYLATDWEEFAHYMCKNHHHHSETEGSSDHLLSSTINENSSASTHNDSKDPTTTRVFLNRCPSSFASSDMIHKNDTESRMNGVVVDHNKQPELVHVENIHIHDVDLHSEAGHQVLFQMLTDWLVLALSKTSAQRKKYFAKRKKHNDGIALGLIGVNGTTKNATIVGYGSTFVETADLQWTVV